jgi:hypothetical protein
MSTMLVHERFRIQGVPTAILIDGSRTVIASDKELREVLERVFR